MVNPTTVKQQDAARLSAELHNAYGKERRALMSRDKASINAAANEIMRIRRELEVLS